MRAQPSESMQQGKTEFWEGIVDERLEEYHDVISNKSVLRPIDYIKRLRRLKRLEAFILRASTILNDSLTDDKIIADHKARTTSAPDVTSISAARADVAQIID